MTFPADRPIRWGIIGCGNVTEVKSGPAYQQTEGFELLGVMRRDAEKLADYARRHGVPRTYSRAEDLVADPDIDAVYVATPPDSHLEYGLMVAAAGKPCCIEKPLAPSYEACRTITEAFAAKELPLFTAYYRRSLPRFERVKELLDEGWIGEVRHVSRHYSRPPTRQDLAGADNWRTDARVAPGGYFDDLASHGLDLLAWLLGDFTDLVGFSLNQQRRYTAKDAMTASWLHEGKITGAGSWNFGSRIQEDRVDIHGGMGTISFAVFDEGPIVIKNGLSRKEEHVAHPATVQLPHVRNMARHFFEEGYTHPSSGGNGARVAWVMDRILGSGSEANK